LEEAYKLKGVTPTSFGIWLTKWLEEAYKLKGVTP